MVLKFLEINQRRLIIEIITGLRAGIRARAAARAFVHSRSQKIAMRPSAIFDRYKRKLYAIYITVTVNLVAKEVVMYR